MQGLMDKGRTRLKCFEAGLDITGKCRQKCGLPVGFQLFLAGGFFYGFLPAIFKIGVIIELW
jgi:hypothetical protein